MSWPFTFPARSFGQRGVGRLVALCLLAVLMALGAFFWLQPEKSKLDPTWEVVRRTEIVQVVPPQLHQPALISSAVVAPTTRTGWSSSEVEALALAWKFCEEENYPQARQIFSQLWQIHPDDHEVKKGFGITLLWLGVRALENRAYFSAEDDLLRSLDLYPGAGTSGQVLLRLYLKMGRVQEAQPRAIDLMASFPDNPSLHFLGAKVAFLSGDFEGAVLRITRALELRPDWKEAQRWKEELERELQVWNNGQRFSSAHFVCVASADDLGMVQLSKYVSEVLEASARALVADLNLRLTEPVLVLLMRKEDFRAHAPDWSAGIFDGRIRLAVEEEANADAFEATVRHEVTHAVLHRLGYRLPTWMDEGLAQYMEGKSVARARDRLVEAAFRGELPTGKALQGEWSSWEDRHKVSAAYDFALSMTCWVEENYGRSALIGLVRELRHESLENLSLRLLGRDFADVQSNHRQWLEEGMP